jgi:hypothetical protein
MFKGGSRGQAEVIGFVLIFALLVSLVGINQAFFVPLENERIEFQHSQDVRDDMVALRNSGLEASISNEQQAASVRLGTSYPNRFLALNPSPPAGTLRTVEPDGNGGSISVESTDFDIDTTCGVGEDPLDTKFLTYEADYNEHQSALPITLENSVVHRKGGAEPVLDTEQSVISGNQIRITRLIGDYRATGSRTESVDVLPSDTGRNITNESLTIELPTRVPESKWEELLSEEIDDGYIEDEDSVTVEDAVVTIEMEDPEEVDGLDSYVVRCTTIGLDEQPDVDPVKEPFIGGDTTTSFNPTGPGTVELIEADRDKKTADLTFKNRIPTAVTAVEARIPYATGSGFSAGDTINVAGTEVPIGAPPVGLDPRSQLMWDPGTNSTVEVTGIPSQNTGFALELKYVDSDTGETVARYIYFVSAD